MMASVLPQGESIRKAIRWISETRNQHPEKNLFQIIEEASQRFNLSPRETDFLIEFYRQATNGEETPDI